MDTNELQYLFHEQFSQFDTPENRVFNLWNEILTHYSEPHRHYHNLNHLHFFIASSYLADHRSYNGRQSC